MVAEKWSGDLTIEFPCDKINRFCQVLIAGDESKEVLMTSGIMLARNVSGENIGKSHQLKTALAKKILANASLTSNENVIGEKC